MAWRGQMARELRTALTLKYVVMTDIPAASKKVPKTAVDMAHKLLLLAGLAGESREHRWACRMAVTDGLRGDRKKRTDNDRDNLLSMASTCTIVPSAKRKTAGAGPEDQDWRPVIGCTPSCRRCAAASLQRLFDTRHVSSDSFHDSVHQSRRSGLAEVRATPTWAEKGTPLHERPVPNPVPSQPNQWRSVSIQSDLGVD